jgi:hypothetical protein
MHSRSCHLPIPNSHHRQKSKSKSKNENENNERRSHINDRHLLRLRRQQRTTL